MSVQGHGGGNTIPGNSSPTYTGVEQKQPLWLRITYRLNSFRYLIGPWFWAGASIYALWLATKFVVAVENSHLLIGLVD